MKKDFATVFKETELGLICAIMLIDQMLEEYGIEKAISFLLIYMGPDYRNEYKEISHSVKGDNAIREVVEAHAEWVKVELERGHNQAFDYWIVLENIPTISLELSIITYCSCYKQSSYPFEHKIEK